MTDSFERVAQGIKDEFSKFANTKEGVRYLKIRTLVDIPSFSSKVFLGFLSKAHIGYTKLNRTEFVRIRKELFENSKISEADLNNILRLTYDEVIKDVPEEIRTIV